jgi:hypothetical protein
VVLAASLLGMPLASPASAADPSFVPPPAVTLRFPNVGYQSAPTFADLDGDGDLDAFIGERYGDTFFFENTGTSTAPAFAAPATRAAREAGGSPFRSCGRSAAASRDASSRSSCRACWPVV